MTCMGPHEMNPCIYENHEHETNANIHTACNKIHSCMHTNTCSCNMMNASNIYINYRSPITQAGMTYECLFGLTRPLTFCHVVLNSWANIKPPPTCFWGRCRKLKERTQRLVAFPLVCLTPDGCNFPLTWFLISVLNPKRSVQVLCIPSLPI